MTNEEKARQLSQYPSGDIDIVRYDVALDMAEWKDEQFYRVLAIIKVSLEKQGVKFNESFIKDCVNEYFKE